MGSWEDNVSPMGAELAKLKARLELDKERKQQFGKKAEKAIIDSKLECSWCKEKITDQYYYECETHGDIFCEYCATKTGEYPTKEFPVCKWQKVDKKNCIWKRLLSNK